MRSFLSRRFPIGAFLLFLTLAFAPLACAGGRAALADDPSTSSDSAEMPAYCSTQDVIDAYSMEQMAQVTGDPGGVKVDREQVKRAVDSYGAHVSAHVRMQYPSDPFDYEHDYLNSLNVEGAFLLMQKRTPGGMEETLQDAEERLDGLLLKIAEGELDLHDLGEDEADEDETELDPDELIRAAPRRFGSHRWRGSRGLS